MEKASFPEKPTSEKVGQQQIEDRKTTEDEKVEEQDAPEMKKTNSGNTSVGSIEIEKILESPTINPTIDSDSRTSNEIKAAQELEELKKIENMIFPELHIPLSKPEKTKEDKYPVSPNPSLFYSTARGMIKYLNPVNYSPFEVPEGYQLLKFRGFPCRYMQTVGYCRNRKSCKYYHHVNEMFPKICLDFGITSELNEYSLNFWDFEVEAKKTFGEDAKFYIQSLNDKVPGEDMVNDKRYPKSADECLKMLDRVMKQFSDLIDGSEETLNSIKIVSEGQLKFERDLVRQHVKHNIRDFDLCVKIFFAADFINVILKRFVFFSYFSYSAYLARKQREEDEKAFLNFDFDYNEYYDSELYHQSNEFQDIQQPLNEYPPAPPITSEPVIVENKQIEEEVRLNFEDKELTENHQEQDNKENKKTPSLQYQNKHEQKNINFREDLKKKPEEEKRDSLLKKLPKLGSKFCKPFVPSKAKLSKKLRVDSLPFNGNKTRESYIRAGRNLPQSLQALRGNP